ncbi:MAG: CDP-archaeol synthase [Desulfobacterales bacterium]
MDLKLLFLLWLINFIPPLLSYLLDNRYSLPIDLNKTFTDKKPFFGPHKTWRGLIGALFCGSLLSLFLGFPVWLGFLAAILSMLGDLLSSFAKRRLDKPSGHNFPVLDQFFEGALPFLVLSPYFGVGLFRTGILIIIFCIGAYLGSVFYKDILLKEPFPLYPRILKASTRFKEINSCSLALRPLYPFFHFEEAIYYHMIIKWFFKIAGLYDQGKQNALDINLALKKISVPRLPDNFGELKILYFSDLHLDGLEGLDSRMIQILEKHEADICIFGGDLRMASYGDYSRCLELFSGIMTCVKARYGKFAVLGNHDCLEMMPSLEKMGIKVLVNDSHRIENDGQEIYIIGVDDPHYYKCANIQMALDGVPENAFKIFLCHTPEMFKEAAANNMDLYLCGHTHAGQVQLPVIGPVFTHSRSPRFMVQGFWKEGLMQGYTSSGVGVSGVPVRFLTRGEIVVLTLVC